MDDMPILTSGPSYGGGGIQRVTEGLLRALNPSDSSNPGLRSNVGVGRGI